MGARHAATLLMLATCWLLAMEAASANSVESATGYAGRCALCHDGNGFGVQRLRARLGEDFALLTQRQDLTAPFIRQVVRHGFLAMPPMSRVEVPDDELEAIIRYLTEPATGAE